MTPPALHGLAPPIITAVAAGKPWLLVNNLQRWVLLVGMTHLSGGGREAFREFFDQVPAEQNAANRSYN
jgi:hypothetical protein